MKLQDKLNGLDLYPFHMPGHKRNKKFNIIGSEIDITEITGFDNLHNPEGILLDLQNRYQKLYHSEKSILSVNGSTACILSAISAVCSSGDTVIIARNCHKSVYNACFINRLKVKYIVPDYDEEFNCFVKITQDKVDKAVRENPDAKAIVITSPTYEGVVSTIKADIPVILDAAHGAHFGLYRDFPDFQRGDIVIHSLHKTLPCLTSSAVVNIYNKKYTDSVGQYMDIFETSSPSYILLAAIEKCADYLESEDAEKDFYALCSRLEAFRKKAKRLENIKIFENDDISRLSIKANNLSGYALGELLREQYKIEAEMCSQNYVTLICTAGDTKEGFDRLYAALEAIGKAQCSTENDCRSESCAYSPALPEARCQVWEVEKTEPCCVDGSEGKICGEYIYQYPPGIPIIVPGEIINERIISSIRYSGNRFISDSKLLPNKILTKM